MRGELAGFAREEGNAPEQSPRTLRPNWWIFFEHDLEVPAAKIVEKGTDRFEAVA